MKTLSQHRQRGLSPDRPTIRGTAQILTCFFQARETVNPYYDQCAARVQDSMDLFGKLTGRRYRLFDYVWLSRSRTRDHHDGIRSRSRPRGGRAAARPKAKKSASSRCASIDLSAPKIRQFLPKTVKSIAVLDRTKEPGAIGEPLYQDVTHVRYRANVSWRHNLWQTAQDRGGRYGLSCKEFTPAMAKGVLDDLGRSQPKNHFVSALLTTSLRTALITTTILMRG